LADALPIAPEKAWTSGGKVLVMVVKSKERVGDVICIAITCPAIDPENHSKKNIEVQAYILVDLNVDLTCF
jgi:hypothetical protein